VDEGVDLLAGTGGRGEVIPREGLLGVLMTQDHLVLLHVLDLGVFGDALFVVAVVFLDGLGEEGCHHLSLL
jgi:hypothetical protein